MAKKRKKPDPSHYTKLRAFRLSESEDAAVAATARRLGITVSAWIRAVILSAVPSSPEAARKKKAA